MKAVIMAGGQGTRLRPLTSNQPKPMIPIVNTPCMEHIVRLLEDHGFTEIVVTLQFMPEEIQDYFGDGSDWGVSINYSIEDVPAGTAGSVKLAEEQHLEGERVLVISGDALTDCDLSRVLEFHEENGAEATMVLKSVENPLDFGIVITEEDGRISRFLEKPAWGQVFSDTVNTGIYVLEPTALAQIPSEGEYDFSKELFPKLLEAGRPLYGYVTEDYWEDIGNLEQYMRAQRDVLDGKMRGVRPPGTRLRENVYVGQRAQVDDEDLEGPVVIGENVRVDEGARISPYSVIADNVVVGAGASVERSVIAEGSYVGEGAELVDALVGRSSYIQERARIQERSALGDDVIVGEGATVAPDVKIFPHKTVESGANVTQSLIYETMGLRTIFKGGIVSGKFNVDLTPEFTIRLASSFGTELDPGSIVTVGRDASRAAQVAKRAMSSALLGVGVNVRDLRAAHAGVVRHDVLAGKSVAGAHVRAGEDPDDVEILFFSSGATPMSESDQRAIEKVFVREEYRRAHGADIGELIYPGRAVEQYVQRLEMATNKDKTEGATLVVDFSGGVASLVASRVFARLGINAVVMEGFTNANVVGSPGTSRGVTEASGDDPGTHFAEALERVGRVVPTVGAAFGAVVGPAGEDVQFVDDKGEYVPPDVMLACMLSRMRPKKVVLPINLSRGYEELVREGGGILAESRTGLGNVAIKAAEVEADVAGLADGRYVFPNFLPAPDCFVTLARALELFRTEPASGTTPAEPLSGLRARFKEPFGAVRRRRLECPWGAKGRVMRGLAEKFGGDADAILTDGVKLNLAGGSWVLMLPDPNNPLFYVYAEADGPNNGSANGSGNALGGGSEVLVSEYADLVEGLIRSE
ncbi:MAG: N-acetylglucosamine-1-phosphate uridyltransferase / Phosphoglucosamine mutase [uncultured Rubrobacteraceae bacterium]|uniref:N-acetylglucosamine-1-phosphate uridyltransferase / Phosphoglucosamine mutase n=1 Tax=uncultured Rubrobacteraceae bacterium TaxID=349277 RepID=A0A6J4PWZ6_9ACTN|nr:MAG: N-acetylglucosamine-1-phosphate uridyltransferase / Phosphoglucosamine mutase [uncultured Rubrobacteraceae bacterium]